MVKRVEHVYRSAMMEPKLDSVKFSRGWLNIPENPMMVGSLEEAARLTTSNQFVEIGVKKAGSSLCIMQALNELKKDAQLTCIDVDPEAGKWFKDLVEPLNGKGTAKARFIQGSSFVVGQDFKETCAWVFIDGCHCQDCTASDIQVWAPKVVKDGIVIMHDCDYRVQLRRKPSQRAAHGSKPVGVYSAMMGSEMLMRDFYIVHFMEGALDPKNEYWNGIAIWRRK